MTDLSTPPDAPSPGAERMRRHRELRRQGAINITLLIGADAVQPLTEKAGSLPRSAPTAMR